jgi:hypothetical protein
MIRNGNSQMPAFNLDGNEEEQLVEFLRLVDQTGKADPRATTVSWSGMINPTQDESR